MGPEVAGSGGGPGNSCARGARDICLGNFHNKYVNSGRVLCSVAGRVSFKFLLVAFHFPFFFLDRRRQPPRRPFQRSLSNSF